MNILASAKIAMKFFDLARKFNASYYEGAKITRANSDFVNGNSDFENTASLDRDTIRARARWLHENNPILANIDDTIASNVVGTGFNFQLKLGDKDKYEKLNKEIETKWRYANYELDITKRDTFDYLCKVILKNRFVDGECLAYFPMVDTKKGKELKLQMIEVDRFALGTFNKNNTQFFDGLEVNKQGEVIAYHLNNDPLRNLSLNDNSDIKLNAKDCIYYYKRDNRFTQYRGISEYKHIILDMKNLSAYLSASIQSARARANITAVIKKNYLPNFSKGEQQFLSDLAGNSNTPEMAINGVFMQYLQSGEDISVINPNVVGESFKDFFGTIGRTISAGRGVSFELAFRDYSQVNYSSGRLSSLQDYKNFKENFIHFINYFYIPTFMRWLEFECMMGRISNLNYSQFLERKKEIKDSIVIYPPVREWIDPVKDNTAIKLALQTGTMSLEEILAQRGIDWQEHLIQKQKEQEMIKKLGLRFEFDSDLYLDEAQKETIKEALLNEK